MAGFGVNPSVGASFPLNVLHSGKVPDATAKKSSFIGESLPAHGPEFVAQERREGLSYIGSHLIYVVVFILFTLGLYYMVGKKSTTYFLVLVLLGQLIIPGGTGAGISQLTQNFKIFKG